MRNLRHWAGLAMLALLAAPMGQAATDGSVGSTSTGTFGLTATITGAQVQVTGLQDQTFTDGGALTVTTPVCVKSSTPTVRINISGLHDGVSLNAFNMANGAGDKLPYSIGFLINGVANAMTGFNSWSKPAIALAASCDNSYQFAISRAAKPTTATATGVFTDTVTVLVSPE